MKATVFKGMNLPLEIKEVPTPFPRGDEILIRVASTGICHSDLHYNKWRTNRAVTRGLYNRA